MKTRALLICALTAGGLALGGCQEHNEEADNAVPAGAIPAAADATPGSEQSPGGVQQAGAATDSAAGMPSGDTSGGAYQAPDTSNRGGR